jgi:hypothetical protein
MPLSFGPLLELKAVFKNRGATSVILSDIYKTVLQKARMGITWAFCIYTHFFKIKNATLRSPKILHGSGTMVAHVTHQKVRY